MKLYFTIFPKRTESESYFLRDSNVKLNRVDNKEVDLHLDFERSFSTIAQRRGLDKSEVDRVRKIKQRLPQHKHIGVARLSITILKNRQLALCYLFVCEGNVAYLSAPEMVFCGESMFISSTKDARFMKRPTRSPNPIRSIVTLTCVLILNINLSRKTRAIED